MWWHQKESCMGVRTTYKAAAGLSDAEPLSRSCRSHSEPSFPTGEGGKCERGGIQAATGGSVFPREAKRKWAVRMQGWSPTRDGRGAAAVCWLAVNPQTMQAAAKDVLLGFQLQPESRRRLL